VAIGDDARVAFFLLNKVTPLCMQGDTSRF